MPAVNPSGNKNHIPFICGSSFLFLFFHASSALPEYLCPSLPCSTLYKSACICVSLPSLHVLHATKQSVCSVFSLFLYSPSAAKKKEPPRRRFQLYIKRTSALQKARKNKETNIRQSLLLKGADQNRTDA